MSDGQSPAKEVTGGGGIAGNSGNAAAAKDVTQPPSLKKFGRVPLEKSFQVIKLRVEPVDEGVKGAEERHVVIVQRGSRTGEQHGEITSIETHSPDAEVPRELWRGHYTKNGVQHKWHAAPSSHFCKPENYAKLLEVLDFVYNEFSPSGAKFYVRIVIDSTVQVVELLNDDESCSISELPSERFCQNFLEKNGNLVQVRWALKWQNFRECSKKKMGQQLLPFKPTARPAEPTFSAENLDAFRKQIGTVLSSLQDSNDRAEFQVKLIAAMQMIELALDQASPEILHFIPKELHFDDAMKPDCLAAILVRLARIPEACHSDSAEDTTLRAIRKQLFHGYNPNNPDFKNIVMQPQFIDFHDGQISSPLSKGGPSNTVYLSRWFCHFCNVKTTIHQDDKSLKLLNRKVGCLLRFLRLRESISTEDCQFLQDEKSTLIARMNSTESDLLDLISSYDEDLVKAAENIYHDFFKQWQELQHDLQIQRATHEMRSLYIQVKDRLRLVNRQRGETGCFLERIESDLQTALQKIQFVENSEQMKIMNPKEILARAEMNFKRVIEFDSSQKSQSTGVLRLQILQHLADLDELELFYKDMQSSILSFDATLQARAQRSDSCREAEELTSEEFTIETTTEEVKCSISKALNNIMELRESAFSSPLESDAEFGDYIGEQINTMKQKSCSLQLEITALLKTKITKEDSEKLPNSNLSELFIQLSTCLDTDSLLKMQQALSDELTLRSGKKNEASPPSPSEHFFEHLKRNEEEIMELGNELLLQLQLPRQSRFCEGPTNEQQPPFPPSEQRQLHQLQWVAFVRERSNEERFLFVIQSLIRQEAMDVLFPDNKKYKNLSLRYKAYAHSLSSFTEATKDRKYGHLEDPVIDRLQKHFDSLDSKHLAWQYVDERMLMATSIDPRRIGICEFVKQADDSSVATLQNAYDQQWRILKKHAQDLGMPLSQHHFADYFDVPSILSKPPDFSDVSKLKEDLEAAISEFNLKNQAALPYGIFFPHSNGLPTIREMWEALEYAYRLFPFQSKRRDPKYWEAPLYQEQLEGRCWWQREGYCGLEPFPHEFATKATVDQHPQFWVFDRDRSRGDFAMYALTENQQEKFSREPDRKFQYSTSQPALVEYCWLSSPTIFEDWEKEEGAIMPANCVRDVRGRNSYMYEAHFCDSKSKQQFIIRIELEPLAKMFRCDACRNVISKHELKYPPNKLKESSKRRGSAITAYQVDHLFPWICGGLTVIQNLQALQHNANVAKLNDHIPSGELCFGLPSPKLLDMYVYLHYVTHFRRHGSDFPPGNPDPDVDFDKKIGIDSDDREFGRIDSQDISAAEREIRRSNWVLKRLEQILCYHCPTEEYHYGGLNLSLMIAQNEVLSSMKLRCGLPREKTQITMLTINKGRQFYKTILYKIYPEIDSNSTQNANLQPGYQIPSYQSAVNSKFGMRAPNPKRAVTERGSAGQ